MPSRRSAAPSLLVCMRARSPAELPTMCTTRPDVTSAFATDMPPSQKRNRAEIDRHRRARDGRQERRALVLFELQDAAARQHRISELDATMGSELLDRDAQVVALPDRRARPSAGAARAATRRADGERLDRSSQYATKWPGRLTTTPGLSSRAPSSTHRRAAAPRSRVDRIAVGRNGRRQRATPSAVNSARPLPSRMATRCDWSSNARTYTTASRRAPCATASRRGRPALPHFEVAA